MPWQGISPLNFNDRLQALNQRPALLLFTFNRLRQLLRGTIHLLARWQPRPFQQIPGLADIARSLDAHGTKTLNEITSANSSQTIKAAREFEVAVFVGPQYARLAPLT